MPVHVAPTTGCNLGCDYCYENPDREMSEDWVESEYNLDDIMERLRQYKEKYPHETPGFHGGEPLLMKTEDMEYMMEWIHDNYDEGGHIQTNGTMIGSRDIELFKEYDWTIGISCDGPDELNSHRVAYEGGEDATRKHTKKTNKNIRRLAEEGITVGVIVVLHKGNAGTEEKLDRLLEWMTDLASYGVSGHFNPAIPYEDVQEDLSLSPERLKEVYLRTWEWVKSDRSHQWDPCNQYVDNLLGLDLQNCVNNKCDIYNAGSAKIITGEGETSGCGKTWSGVGDGGVFLQGESTGNEFNETEERYEALKQTPGPEFVDDSTPDMGGCHGCKYWNVCQGGCPSSGMNFDYRNRTIWCEAKYALYEQVEKDLRTILPNVTTVSDFPWNANLSDEVHAGIDIKPFAAMDPSAPGAKSASKGFEHPEKSLKDRVPDRVFEDVGPEQWAEVYRKRGIPEEHITVSENGVHADSNLPHNSDGSQDGMEKSRVSMDDIPDDASADDFLTPDQRDVLESVTDERTREKIKRMFIEDNVDAAHVSVQANGFHADSDMGESPPDRSQQQQSRESDSQLTPAQEAKLDEVAIPQRREKLRALFVEQDVDPEHVTVTTNGYHADSSPQF